MADSPVDFSGLDDSGSLYVPIDSSLQGISADSTDPTAVAPDPGLFGTVGPEPMVSDGVATADTLSSIEGISTSSNTDPSFADGSFGISGSDGTMTFYDADGNQIQATQDANGFYHLSDGSVYDPTTGLKWNAEGDSVTSDPSKPGAPASGGSGGFAPVGNTGSGSSRSLGGGSPASAAQNSTALSKALGSLGASIASLLGKPKNPTPQQIAKNQATLAGQPSALSGMGTGVFVIGALALIFLLVKGR